MSKASKSVILYHRSYRKISGSVGSFFLQFLFLALPFSLIIALFYPEITRAVCLIAHVTLSPYFPLDTVRIIETPYVIGDISVIHLPGRFPSILTSLINAIVCLILLVCLPKIEKAKPLITFCIVVAFINFASSLFFLFSPHRFPYELADYSELYIKQQIGIWFFVPVIMGFAMLPLPSSLISKSMTMLLTVFYSLVFGTVRYVVFLFILAKVSLLYMAMLFFVFGPLIDFVYIVGIYSIHAMRLAKKIKGDFGFWKWSY
jgi:hypothetical protein